MNPGIIDKLIDRLDKLEPEEIQSLVLKAVEEKGFLERVFDVLREGVIVTGARGKIHYINHTACEFFGLEQKSASGESVLNLFPGINWEEVVASGDAVNRDLVVRYPERRFLNFYIAPLANQDAEESDDDQLGLVIILRDNTRHREQQIQEIESEKIEAVQSLAAGVAHEIGNPLNSLTIHLQVIERKIKKNADPELAAELLESLEITRSEIKRLDFIVEKFLNAVRPSRPELEATDLNELLNEALNFIGAEVADRRIAITLDFAEDVPLLKLDRDQMKQVFYNLVRNSAQAMGSDGNLTVRTGFNDDNAFVTFADDGPGIPPDQVSRVFEPYYTTKKTGSGLGLMIVHRIVSEHGGEVQFQSREGTGTEVTVFLPRAERLVRVLPEHSESEATVIDVDVEE
ncbi:MAG: ATP-binding protein [Verrucomicrobiales bacterium]|nr:ATP-binding protein [Verrucomicrobiales bacterium]